MQKQNIVPTELLFVREFVELSTQLEQRFFVVQNKAFGVSGTSFPSMLKPALAALKSRWFYTMDVAHTQTDQPITTEVGDGQVSDTKEWGVAGLYSKVISQLPELATT